jgi:hypothetical protein
MLKPPNEIISNILAKSFGLEKYSYLIDNLNKTNISVDTNYQKIFNTFYVVRRDKTWRKTYYLFFESQKENPNLGFEEVLYYLYKKTGFVEPSFSSKLLSTINPNMPIWDLYVLKNLNIVLKQGKPRDRLELSVILYKKIQEYYVELLKTSWAEKAIILFNNLLPEYSSISMIKKLDFFIWQIR